MDDVDLVRAYITDINYALKDIREEDILVIFRDLYNKEQSFAKRLRSTGYGRKVYFQFIKMIQSSRGGIKIAKTYFRAREESYLLTVNKAIREANPKLMHDVPVNYKFCKFAVEAMIEKKDEELVSLFNEIKALREEIINKHLFLSLNKAKVFKKNSYGTMTPFEDLIQIANEALIIAVDKYVMDKDSSSFHSMAIGRIIAHLITDGETSSSVTVGQHAKKKLYSIRKLLQSSPNFSTKEISDALKIAEDEVVDLLGTTSYQSLDDFTSEDSSTRVGEVFVKSTKTETNQYGTVEKENLLSVLDKSYDVLSVIEKKVLRLKGVRIDENAPSTARC